MAADHWWSVDHRLRTAAVYRRVVSLADLVVGDGVEDCVGLVWVRDLDDNRTRTVRSVRHEYRLNRTTEELTVLYIMRNSTTQPQYS